MPSARSALIDRVHDVMFKLVRCSTSRSILGRIGLPKLSTRSIVTDSRAGIEEVHKVQPDQDELDQYLSSLVARLPRDRVAVVRDLYSQYHNEAGLVLDRVVPYEERPSAQKRADRLLNASTNDPNNGIVLVVHGQLSQDGTSLLKTTVCSGFVVNASVNNSEQGDTIITCAHTLEEIYRHMCREETSHAQQNTVSFVVPPNGQPRIITKLLSSMPRSDVIVLEAQAVNRTARLHPLPLSPYPVHTGTPILTHLFGSPEAPVIRHSMARTKALRAAQNSDVEEPVPFVAGHAWRRWGLGMMLGYRSYTGLELEAGISSVLPHILTRILPTSGSSGGPVVHAETGTVVGMTSGRRMDNRVEGERGWGCSAESIFEMFSLSGFMPSSQHKHPYP